MVITFRPGKGRYFNKQTKKSGKLTKDGRIYKNNLLDTDLTSQEPTRRKLNG